MPEQADPMDKAIRQLGYRRVFRHSDREIEIACLVRTPDWRPLNASWWSGKEVCVIGADLLGNFFLRHCDGTVRYWDHGTQSDVVLARSVNDFVAGITE